MNKIPESGYFNTNKFARIYLEGIKEITGENGLFSLLNYASLGKYIKEYPPDNLEKEFDFASFSMINQALEDIYGSRGGKGLAIRVGRSTFDELLKGYGALAGVGDTSFKILPLQSKIKFGLEAMARLFSEKSDQITTVQENEDSYLYQIKRCPVCWGREIQEKPICYFMVGLLKEGLHWVSGGKEFTIVESQCIGAGNEICEFVIQNLPFD